MSEGGKGSIFTPEVEIVKETIRQVKSLMGSRAIDTDEAVPKIVRSIRKRFTGSETYRFRDMVRDRLENELRRPQVVLLRDKVSFALGILNTLMTEAVLLQWPQHLWMLYVFWFPTLMALRAYLFNKQKFGLFLYDFCYFVNLACFLHVLAFPSSPALFAIAFVCATGPVCAAVVAWRNSLVFHDIEKMTTLFIHAYPPLVVFAHRFISPPSGMAPCSAQAEPMGGWPFLPLQALPDPTTGDTCMPPLSKLALLTAGLSYYAVWQLLYVLVVEVGYRQAFVDDPDIMTSKRWFVRAKSGFLYDLARKSIIRMGLLSPDQHFDMESNLALNTFLVSQLIYTIITMLPPIFLFDSMIGTIIWLSVIFLDAMWNGATYYIDVFSTRYRSKIEALLEHIDSSVQSEKTAPKEE